ncbi:hypothetical protein ACH4TX_33215 [Streptomyces sp. NPDC021098]|uniref:hypothetical protein n=1 Tax=unclassified Streptomyces TaxID=2593676 RepID=UPI0037B734CA
MAGLTACGSDKSDDGKASGKGDSGGQSVGSPLAALKLASKQTDQQHSAKIDGTIKSPLANSAMTGSMDWADGMRADMQMKSKGGASAAGGGKPVNVRYTPDAMFMNAAAMGIPAQGKEWIKYDYDVLAQQGGPSGAYLKDQMQNNNPSRSVQLLLATGQVKKVGTEDVRGVGTTHYTGVVKVSEIARAQSKGLSQSELDALEKQLKQSGADSETVDLWIDDKNLLVKKREQAESKTGTTDSTVYYSDYGTKVTVEEPPASDTMDFQKLQQPSQP